MCLSTGKGVFASVHAGIPYRPKEHIPFPWSRHPPEQTPPRSRHPPEQTPPGADTPRSRHPQSRHPRERRPLLRTVLILLECILVFVENYFNFRSRPNCIALARTSNFHPPSSTHLHANTHTIHSLIAPPLGHHPAP